METIQFGRWKIRADINATRQAYEGIIGTTSSCNCSWCKNFVVARDQIYPNEALSLFNQLGIDYRKESESYAYDQKGNSLFYRFWFHFIGTIEEGKDAWELTSYESDDVLSLAYWQQDLEIVREYPLWFALGFTEEYNRRKESSHVPGAMKSGFVVQLEFRAEVPWLISEPIPTLGSK